MQTIRAYNPSDIEAVVKLWWETWQQTFPRIKHPQPYPLSKARFGYGWSLAMDGVWQRMEVGSGWRRGVRSY